MPTIHITRVRWYDRDVHDGDLPRYATDNARAETYSGTVAECVRWTRDEGATEWSTYPAVEWTEHGWFASPNGSREIYGGDLYNPGYDREETTVRVSGDDAAVVWGHVVNGTEPDED